MLHLADVTLQQRDHAGVRKLPKFRVVRDISRPIFDDRIDPQLEIIGQVGGVCRDPSGEPHHLVPDRVERLTINLGHICHTIGAGHRIEVDLTSSNFRAAPRNTNSGNPILANDSDADVRVAGNTIHHAELTPTFLELPVLRPSQV